jgi:serine/threonine protein kinase
MLRMGTIFGRYRIEGVAGTGGMGVVYRTTDTETGQPAALKVVSSVRTLDEENRERLLREAQLVARIDHPGVVPVYEAGELDGHFYLAMLWVDGSDLDKLLTDLGPLPIDRAVDVLSQVADALDAAHERGFVHRDVKPANVMVADSGQVYLTDFGLTKVLDASTGLTHTGQLLGTVDYVAPEQIEGRPVDGRADVYSLGGLAYRAITGSVPFDRPGGVARLWAHLNVPPPSVRAKRPDAPRALDAAIRRALAKSPDERYPTAGAFALAAREALGELVPTAVDGGIEERVPALAGASGWEWEPPEAASDDADRRGRTISLPFGRVRAPMALGLGYAMVVATVLGGVVLGETGKQVRKVAAGAGVSLATPKNDSKSLAVAEPHILSVKPSHTAKKSAPKVTSDASSAVADAGASIDATLQDEVTRQNRAQRRAAQRAARRARKRAHRSPTTIVSNDTTVQQPVRRASPSPTKKKPKKKTTSSTTTTSTSTAAPAATAPAATTTPASTTTPAPTPSQPSSGTGSGTTDPGTGTTDPGTGTTDPGTGTGDTGSGSGTGSGTGTGAGSGTEDPGTGTGAGTGSEDTGSGTGAGTGTEDDGTTTVVAELVSAIANAA